MRNAAWPRARLFLLAALAALLPNGDGLSTGRGLVPAGALRDAGAADAAELGQRVTATAPSAGGFFVPPRFFGMHIEQQFQIGWPDVPFGTQRAWDAYPPVDWMHLNPARGVFDWTNLDRLVTDSLSHGVDLVYVFGHVPNWASSNPSGLCGEAPAGSCFPPDMQAWTDFVAGVTARYRGRIGYWELWNEPNARDFWQGTPAQMADMARRAYTLIKASGGVALSPSPQGKNGPGWMARYLDAGGGASADVNAFHGYLDDAPEALLPLVAAYRALDAAFGIENKPLWDTEDSWGENNRSPAADPDQRAAWLARFTILSAADGLERSIWYGWQYSDWGSLYDKATRSVLKPGRAYRQVHDWLVNASVGACARIGPVYRCPIRQPGGSEALAVWSTGAAVVLTAPPRWTRFRTIDGGVETIGPSHTVSIGMAPILLEP